MKLKAFLQGIPFQAWVVVYVAFCSGLVSAMLGSVTPELRAELGNYQVLGFLMTAWATGSIVGAVQGGRLAQTRQARPLFLTYCTVGMVALLPIVFGSSVAMLTLGFFSVAVVEAALVTLGHSVLARVYAEPQARSRVLSLIDVAFSLGNLATPLLVIWLHGFSDGWRLPYQAFYVPLIIAMGLFWWHRPPGAAASPSGREQPSEQLAVPTAMSYRDLLSQPVVAWGVAAGALGGFMEWAQYFWCVSYGMEVQHLSADAARFNLQFFIAGMFASRCWQAFWHSSWTLQQKLWRLNLLATAGLALTVLFPSHGWMPVYALGSFAFGLGNGVLFPALLALMINHLPSQASRLSALLMASFTIGAQAAGVALGSAADWLGLHAAYASLLVAALGFIAVTAHLRRVS